MSNVLRKLLGGALSDRQARAMLAYFAVAIVVLLTLLLASLGIWLLGLLWNVSVASPFHPWAFVAGLVLACVFGGLAWYLANRVSLPHSSASLSTKTSDTFKALSDERQRVLTTSISGAQQRFEPVAPTALTMKNLILKTFRNAELTLDLKELDKAERLNEEYVRDFSMADSGGADWASDMRSMIAGLRKRI